MATSRRVKSLPAKFLASLQSEGPTPALQKLFRYIKQRVLHHIRSLYPALGLESPLRNPDREFLENVIFPQISSDGAIERILFVGVEYYTWHYSKQFRHKQFHTLDIEEDHAAFGNQGLHTIGSVADLTTLFGTDVFDLVLINGLVPAHLSEKTQIDQALVESFRVLKSGGRLIIGWNNYGTLGFLLEDLDGYGLFSTYVPDGVTTPSNRVEANAENKHTFDFLLKPPS